MRKSLELSNSGIKLLITKQINGKQEVLFSKKEFIDNVDYFDMGTHDSIATKINNLITESHTFLDIFYDSIDIAVPVNVTAAKYKKTEIVRINSSKFISKREVRDLKNELTRTENRNYKEIYFKPIIIKCDNKQISKAELFNTKGKKLLLEGFAYYIESQYLSLIENIIEKTKINFNKIYPIGINFGAFTKNDDQKLLVIDLGYKHTTLMKYINNNQYDSKTFEIGAKNIINSIKTKFDQDEYYSRKYLETFGEIPPENIKDNRTILTNYDDEKQSYIEYTMKDLSTIITDKINKIFDTIVPVIKKYKNHKVVITGGLSDLKGLLEYVQTRYDGIIFEINISNTIGAKETSFINCFALNEILGPDDKLVNTNETKINDKIKILSLINIRNIIKKKEHLKEK
jgi:cell division ATPase FtsA